MKCPAAYFCGATILLSLSVWLTPALPSYAAEPKEWIADKANLDSLVELYQEFHRNPELSFHEKETAARFAEQLRKIGAEVTTGIGGHGVVAVLKNGNGPTLLLRTDLDALPVTEQTNLPYASKVRVKDASGVEVGVMHACGHDLHITNLIGVARYLAANKPRWQGTIVFIGQPAEERGAGAQKMLADGLFTKFPRPDFALALHVDSTLRTGKVGYRGGYSMANVDSVDITMQGRGGHGAQPHTTIDPIVQAAHLVVDLQSIVARELTPIEPAVVTVGSIHGGTKHNIIGNTCHLQLTVRSYSDATRKQLLDAIVRKAKAAAASARAPEPTIKISDGTPALFNDERLVDRVVPVFLRELGEENVIPVDPSMGGEDFSEYGRAGVPIFMFRLGAVNPERMAKLTEGGNRPPSLHSSTFYPDAAEALQTGVTVMSAAVLELLSAKTPAANEAR